MLCNMKGTLLSIAVGDFRTIAKKPGEDTDGNLKPKEDLRLSRPPHCRSQQE